MLYKSFAFQFRLLTIVLLSVVVTSCGDGDGPTPVLDPTPPAAEVYTLVWADEFDVDGPPNVQNWRMETGYGDNGWGNNEWQLYTDDTSSPNNNVRVENGNLVITARCSVADTAPDQCNSAVRNGVITSARINSKDKFEIKYGNIQARIKTPPGKGMWPAFWSLGSVFPDTPWPRAGEIDFMEMHQFFSNDRTTHFTVHWCDDSRTAPDQCEFDPGWTFDSRFKTFDEVLTDDYHIFEAEWDEDRIIGKIDGIPYFSRPIDWTTEEEFHKSFFMILNIAVGGTLGGPPDASTTWPQEMLVDWVRVYERNKPDVVELVPDDRTTPLPFVRILNSVEFGGDSVVPTIQRTVSEDDDDFETITPPAVTPLTGNTILELDYQSANTFFSGGAFLFKLKDLTHYEKLVFSLDTSAFTNFDDISVEMQDDRFTGDGTPGKSSVPLSNYTPISKSGDWETYEIPLTDFNLTNLDNVALFGFWNPNNAADQLIAGKLYLDDIKFVNVPCTANATVSFDADSYPANATTAQITVTDTCLANKNKTVVALVDNGTETIGVGLTVGASGQGVATVNFGPTSDASSTIAINEGDILTLTYQDTNGVKQTDTASITAGPSVLTLGVYSETNINPVLTYNDIINAIDLGGKDTATDDMSTAIPALEGNLVLSANYTSAGVGGDYNGFIFDFGPPLVNGTFEADDASAGNVAGATGWTTFEFVFTNNTAGPGFGPVSHDAGGSQSLVMFGPFSFDSASGAYQADDSIEAGKSYTATAHVMNWNGDNLAPDNLGIFQLTFWDAPGGADGGGNNLGTTEIIVDSTDDGTNIYLPGQDGADISDWTELSITEVAPVGAVSAQVFLLHIQLNDPAAGGSIFWDDVSLKPVEPNDVTSYEVLRFGLNATAASTLMDLEVKMEDSAGGAASVFLSDYTATPSAVSGWDLYEIPLPDFAGVSLTDVTFLGYWNASSTVTGSTSVPPTLFDAILYFDDVHFATGASIPPPPTVLTGVLVNSPIEGVTFQTATQSGITNALGQFQYVAGEMVTFSIGGIILGTVQGAPIITPVELTGSVDPTAQPATNLLVFLQSIDADSIHSNGITISAATQAAAVSQNLVFTEPGFSNQIAAVVAAIVDPADPDKTVVGMMAALDNFYDTYVFYNGTDTFSWLFPGYPPVPAPAPVETLGVYSETNTNPVLTYSEIIDNDTVTNETSMLVVALEGVNSLQADYALPASGNESGYDFNFGPAGGGGSVNLLNNGGFESTDASGGDVSGATDWDTFESVFTNSTLSPSSGPVSHDDGGTQSLKMFGPFTGTGSAAGAFQGAGPVTAGTEYELSAWVMNWIGDPFGNLGILQLSFWDGANGTGNQLGGNLEITVDPFATADVDLSTIQDGAEVSDWTQLTVSGVAPAGAVSAKAFLLHIQTGDPCCAGGSLFWDDVSLAQAAPVVTGSDISAYATLKFGINTSAASGLLDLEVKMKTAAGAESSVFLSNYTPTPGAVAGWDVYEIPLVDFDDPAQLDLTDIVSLGFWNPSSTLTGSTAVAPTLLPGTLYFDDIHFAKTATPPPSNTIGVYSETNVNPVLAYSEIINAADFGGNVTNPNELSMAVTPLDGSFVLQALFLNSSQAFGGIIFNFDTVRPAVNGQDISAYNTLKFGIDTSGMPTFADLVVQLEDGSAVSKVFLSAYTPTTSNNWEVYAIPLSAFTGLDLTNLTYLGFWNASSTVGAESPLVFGPLYFDDIHFTK